ncbi:unnamed protein product [Mytilus coruscus]|uniref:Ig-like domain-containing protein n=1 Tax=Mytilus coruscus TaxID=42192 RepID=A0A6J8CS60_MYTCO|nr:unnamed protein product [Mytilus coruscus]
MFETIATYNPDQTPNLTTNGQYLKGRVTLTPITQSSIKAVMTFNKLMCIDETFYKCQVVYQDSSGTHFPIANNISILVQVPPSKPDSVSLVHTPADSSVTTTKHMDYSTSSPSTAVTTNEYNTVSASKMENQNTTTAFNHSTIQTTGHNTTTSTPSPENDSSNVSYKTTTYSIQQTTTEQVIVEGDNITVVCTGDVGNPPAEHFFQKNCYGHTAPVNYTASATSKIEISDNCSYYRTSNLTFQVKAEDNNAVIRCVVNSSLAEPDMYVEMAPIEVYYEASMPNITKYPNKSYYVVGEDTSILLTCKSDGNPKPYYQWYKENDNELISTNESWTIKNMNVTNSGVYTCNVSNTFNGDTYRNAKNVHIDIMNKGKLNFVRIVT